MNKLHSDKEMISDELCTVYERNTIGNYSLVFEFVAISTKTKDLFMLARLVTLLSPAGAL